MISCSDLVLPQTWINRFESLSTLLKSELLHKTDIGSITKPVFTPCSGWWNGNNPSRDHHALSLVIDGVYMPSTSVVISLGLQWQHLHGWESHVSIKYQANLMSSEQTNRGTWSVTWSEDEVDVWCRGEVLLVVWKRILCSSVKLQDHLLTSTAKREKL